MRFRLGRLKPVKTKTLGLVAVTATGFMVATPALDARQVTSHSQGLHDYISFGHDKLPPKGDYTAGMGFYAAVWSLVDQPLADFQIGLPSAWITPDNPDDQDTPLAPERTLARTWKERGPTWSSVFQTVEGGLGYWAGNHFRYRAPKFSMNATPQCYDYEVGSPGWSFFHSNEGNVWGLRWFTNDVAVKGSFPQYFKQVGDEYVAAPEADVPAETGLLAQEFKLARSGVPYTSPKVGAWTQPGPKLGPLTSRLVDGSIVT